MCAYSYTSTLLDIFLHGFSLSFRNSHPAPLLPEIALIPLVMLIVIDRIRDKKLNLLIGSWVLQTTSLTQTKYILS